MSAWYVRAVGYLWADPTNWKNQYRTIDANDSHVPAGYILQSTESSIDYINTQDGDGRFLQRQALGTFSGGYQAYGAKSDDLSRPAFP